MKRPYVICHILSSLDGKINGPFMGTETVAGLSREYGALRGLALRYCYDKGIYRICPSGTG